MLDSGIEGFSAEDIVTEDHFGNGRLRLSESNVYEHLKGILPDASDKQIVKLIG